MRNILWQRLGGISLLSGAILFLTPAWAAAQLREVRAVNPSQFTSYPPSAYSGYATVGPPTYLTSINYPTVYGSWTIGTQWAGPYMSSVLTTPYTTYPETYSPVNPPAAAAYSQLYYQTGPGGSPVPARAPGVETSTLTARANVVPASAPATIDIMVPSEAEIYIQGRKMDLTGSVRHFVTPFLNPGAVYSYDITAKWTENGREMTKTQRVLVKPGEAESVSFTEGTPSTSTLQSTKELP